jgi:hypothetical protein
MAVSIDVLAPQKSHLDLSDSALPTDFGLDDYKLTKLFDDVILIEYCDMVSEETGDYVMRGSIAIPVAQIHNAWRKGKVLLKGPNVRYTDIGEIVMFPTNMGIGISNIDVAGHGMVKHGLFINEQRMFGGCEAK